MADVEERLERLERLLSDIMEKLDVIESMLNPSWAGNASDVVRIASQLVFAFSMPALTAVEAAARVVGSLKASVPRDDITLAAIEGLSTCEPLTISELTRRVRRARGRASRRIVRGRILRLVDSGVVMFVGKERRRRKVTLRECVEGR